jgi:hypothetical protein
MTGVHAKILGLAAFVGVGLGLAQAAHSASGLTACLAECNHAKLSATNKASCRLDCEQDAASDPELIRAQIDDRDPTRSSKPKTTPATRTGPAAGPGCKAACDADRTLSVDDRASCKLDCDLDPDSPVNRGGTDVVKTPPPRGSSPLTFQLAGPPPSESAQAGFLGKCYATCQQGPYKLSPTDFETCKLDCQTMASVVDVARGFVPDVWTTRASTHATTPTAPAQPTRVATHTPPVSPTPAKTTPPARASGTDRSAVEICGEELTACNERCTGAVRSQCERGCSRKHLIETDRETCKLTCETDTEVCQGDCLAANATCVNTRQRQR